MAESTTEVPQAAQPTTQSTELKDTFVNVPKGVYGYPADGPKEDAQKKNAQSGSTNGQISGADKDSKDFWQWDNKNAASLDKTKSPNGQVVENAPVNEITPLPGSEKGVFPPKVGTFPASSGEFPTARQNFPPNYTGASPAENPARVPSQNSSGVKLNAYGEIISTEAIEKPAQETTEQRANRFKEILRRTNLRDLLRIGLVTIIPLLLGRDQGGTNQPAVETHQQLGTEDTVKPDYPNFTEIFKQGHASLIEDLLKMGRSLGISPKTDPFIIPGKEKMVFPSPKNTTETPLQTAPAPDLGEIRMDEAGESLKGWVEKYAAIMNNPDLAYKALQFAKDRGVDVIDPDRYKKEYNEDPQTAQALLGYALKNIEKTGKQLPGNDPDLAAAVKQLDPKLVENFYTSVQKSIYDNNPGIPLGPDRDQMTTPTEIIRNPYTLLKQSQQFVASTNNSSNKDL